ncbi:sigma-70 family RNA polymerase sigma factor [Nocardioides sp. SYSU DS0651]|uniref:sigma-70 family RNA polymerase sigma factor n=1 Tax=Nocardioides sp. SYSU DS0651 TaxID=3415955 RepID=UPI003F4C32F2
MSLATAVPPSTPSVSTAGPVGSHPVLSSEDRKATTAELLARAQEVSGPERDALLEQVIVVNIPVARSLAARYRNRGQSLEELEQVACLALTRSVQAFNPERGDDLLVFAVPSILGELKRHFRDASWSVRPPRRVQELRPRLAEADEELTQELGRAPSPDELAAHLGCPKSEIEEAMACGDLARSSSLDEPVAESGGTLAELLPDTESGFDHSEAVAILGPACRRLKRRDRWILRMRFYDQMTQQEIADELGVTQVQVSRLLQRILTDLRRSIGAEQHKPVKAA